MVLGIHSMVIAELEDMANALSRELWFEFSYIREEKEREGEFGVKPCWKQNQVDICHS